MPRSLYAILALLIPLLALRLILAGFTYPAEKLLLCGLSILGGSWAVSGALRDIPSIRRLYIWVLALASGGTTLLLSLAAPQLHDRKLAGLTIYTIADSKTSMQEELEVTLYKHTLAGRQAIESEFYENGIGNCTLSILGEEGSMSISKNCGP